MTRRQLISIGLMAIVVVFALAPGSNAQIGRVMATYLDDVIILILASGVIFSIEFFSLSNIVIGVALILLGAFFPMRILERLEMTIIEATIGRTRISIVGPVRIIVCISGLVVVLYSIYSGTNRANAYGESLNNAVKQIEQLKLQESKSSELSKQTRNLKDPMLSNSDEGSLYEPIIKDTVDKDAVDSAYKSEELRYRTLSKIEENFEVMLRIREEESIEKALDSTQDQKRNSERVLAHLSAIKRRL